LRRVIRKELPCKVKGFLTRRQLRVDSGDNVQSAWKSARQTKIVGEILWGVLLEMSGKRERCMYCNDSRGTDIEHFWPKVDFPELTFQWENMLQGCAGCNRKKGGNFPLADDGSPLLIDPSIDEPWRFLDFIPETGELTPLWNMEISGFEPKGEATTNPNYLPLNIEAVALGRQKTFGRLVKAVQVFLDGVDKNADLGVATETLQSEVEEHSDYGLDRWVFHFGGVTIEPFARFCAEYPDQWEKLGELIGTTDDEILN